MSSFICDVCGEEMVVNDGILTWTRDNDTLSNFSLSHKMLPGYKCQPQTNNRFKDLYTLAMINGYMEFMGYLLERWENGFSLKDAESLERVLEQLNAHMHEKMILLTDDD